MQWRGRWECGRASASVPRGSWPDGPLPFVLGHSMAECAERPPTWDQTDLGSKPTSAFYEPFDLSQLPPFSVSLFPTNSVAVKSRNDVCEALVAHNRHSRMIITKKRMKIATGAIIIVAALLIAVNATRVHIMGRSQLHIYRLV